MPPPDRAAPLFDPFWFRVAVSPPICDEDLAYLVVAVQDTESDRLIERHFRVQGTDWDEVAVFVQSLTAIYLRWRTKKLLPLLDKYSQGILTLG